MKKLKKVFVVVTLLLLTAVSSLPVFASNDNHGFSFVIQGWQKNSRTNYRYRQTSSVNNPWKVNMTYSAERDGRGNDISSAITRFWLEHPNGENVSASVNQSENMGPVYKNPYGSANKQYVHLTAENNNYNTIAYEVSGVWDEETW